MNASSGTGVVATDLGFNDEKVLVEARKVSQGDLHRYAWASGDYNPIHYNPRIAMQMGLPGVIAHGMLSLAFLNKAIEGLVRKFTSEYARVFRLASIDTRFVGMLQVDDTVTISAKLGRITENGFQLQVWAFKNSQRDQVVCSAAATIENS